MSDEKKERGLPPNREAFARDWALYGCKAKAYRKFYSTENMTPESVWTEAWKLSKIPEVSHRFDEYQKEAADLVGITKAKQLKELIKMADVEVDDVHVKPADKRAALAEINKMLGYYDDTADDDPDALPPTELTIRIINQDDNKTSVEVEGGN